MPFVLHRKFPCALSLIHDVGNQAQVALDEDVPCLLVPGGGQGQGVPFLLGGEGPGKAAGGRLQGLQQGTEQQPNRAEHTYTSAATLCAPARPFSVFFKKGMCFGRSFCPHNARGKSRNTSSIPECAYLLDSAFPANWCLKKSVTARQQRALVVSIPPPHGTR